ncbi:DinB family protein [Niallia sp. 03133]|uniref:DinB family protein n=1 Tax=Niallia sp. 03133 TaxID=3458060 RepID=UPI00404496A1
MNNLIDELENILSSMPEKINSLMDLENRPLRPKWSKKEILGHLCDSGNVNHQRFVDIITSADGLVTLEGYNQDLLVEIHQYHHLFTVEELLHLWTSINKQIVVLLANLSEDQWRLECKLENETIQTLKWLVADYIQHMIHHFKHILAN